MAARFILLKQGLLGEYAFTGKDGVLSYVKQAGCVQYDTSIYAAGMPISYFSPG
jgi:hypothetical protein